LKLSSHEFSFCKPVDIIFVYKMISAGFLFLKYIAEHFFNNVFTNVQLGDIMAL
jgi:hypothetical protein